MINTVQSAITGYTHGDFLTEFIRSGILKPIILMLVIYLTVRVLNTWNGLVRGTWNQGLRFDNQRELQQHRASLDLARVRDEKFDDLERRITELPNQFGTRITFSEEMLGLVSTLATFITFGLPLMWFNPYYALLILVTCIPLALTEFKIVSEWWDMMQSLLPVHKVRTVLQRPYYGNIGFFQSLMFNQFPSLRKSIDLNFDVVMERYEEARKKNARKRVSVNILTNIGIVVVILHASWMVITTAGDIGTLTVIVTTANTFKSSFESIVNLIAEQWNSAKGVLMIEEEFFALKPMLQTPNPVTLERNWKPDIVFDNVSFSYPNQKKNSMVLDKASFRIKSGSKVAIVGASGSGKSTIAALLMRYYDPIYGNVYADNTNLRNILPTDWYEVVSSLSQDYVIHERTIAEEIASSRLEHPVDVERVEFASRFAYFEPVVESDPQGYDTQIGTEFGGREFSGGEKQRLAMARVIYRNTPVLIFDEPDAKLDATSAEKVLDNIFALSGVTVVLITHHVSRAERCDHIVVMDKGKVAEQGSHSELIAKNGKYVRILKKDRERTHGQSVVLPFKVVER